MGKFSLFNSLFILYFVEFLWNTFMGYRNLHSINRTQKWGKHITLTHDPSEVKEGNVKGDVFSQFLRTKSILQEASQLPVIYKN